MTVEATRPDVDEAVDVVGSLLGEDGFQVLNFPTQVPEIATGLQRRQLLRAGAAHGALPCAVWEAVARSVTAPAEVADRLSRAPVAGGLVQEPWQPATLGSLQTTAWLTELFLGPQPRTAAGAVRVRPPELSGVLDDAGEPTALLVARFADRAHLRDYMRAVVVDTRTEGEHYEDSILYRRIAKALLVHPARIEIADTGEVLHVLMVRDGISRLVSSWAALTGISDAQALADEIVDSLLSDAEKSRVAGEQADLRVRAALLKRLRAAFVVGTSDGRPTMDAVRVGQTLAVPVQVYLTVRSTAPRPLQAEQVFNDAIRAVVASIHNDVRQWTKPSQHAETMDRVLPRVAHTGAISMAQLGLATGQLGPDTTPEVFHDDRIPPTALWRAVYLVATLCHPTVDTAVQRTMRDLLGRGRNVARPQYVAMLAPVIDVPWRSAKQHSLATARKAWANGGPIPHDLLRTTWSPVPVGDFTELVPRALAGDRDARATLQVAGGVALVADKLITANVGSSDGRDGRIRKDVHQVVADLGRTVTGLWLLARAANAFRADRPARNSFPERARLNSTHLLHGAYVMPAITQDESGAIRTDAAGGIVELQAAEVLTISELCRRPLDGFEPLHGQSTAPPERPERTPLERVADLRQELAAQLAHTLVQVETLAATARSHGLPPVANHDQWNGLYVSVGDILAGIHSWRPGSFTDPYDSGLAEPEAPDRDDADELSPGRGNTVASHTKTVRFGGSQ